MAATGTITVDDTNTRIQVTGFSPGEQLHVDLRYHHGGVASRYLGVNGYTSTDDAGNVDVTFPLGAVVVKLITGDALDYTDADIHGDSIVVTTKGGQ